MSKKTQRSVRAHSFGSFGDLFGRQIGAFVAREATHERYATIETVAETVGADLSNPEDFRIVDELVKKAS